MVVSEPMKKTIDYQHKETSYLDDTIYETKINFSENRAVIAIEIQVETKLILYEDHVYHFV